MILDQNKYSNTTNQYRTVSVRTLGCRLNLFETDGILSTLKKNGYAITDLDKNPNHVIINTCTVTNRADIKNRNMIRQAIKKNPGSKIWVTGCYAETDRKILESIPGIYGVLGNSEKSSLAYRIIEEDNSMIRDSQLFDMNSVENPSIIEKDFNLYLDRFSYSNVLPQGHTRAYLKIQDGCNRICSYCKIPQARGQGLSREFQDAIDQVKYIQDAGIGEIILTGVNIGWYRNSNNEKAFIPLLEKILSILDYSRLRLSSIEPPDVGIELAELLTHPRFCNFLHIPLQSGSGKILKSMKRSYNPKFFRKRIENVIKFNPTIFLGTDVITGFPEEEEEDFQDTLSILKDYKFARIHAFPYSPRKGTIAEAFGDSISKQVKKDRVLKLTNLSRTNSKLYFENNIGKSLEAIMESGGNLITDNYIKGKLRSQDFSQNFISGQFLDVRIEEVRCEDSSENSLEPQVVFKI